METYTWQSREMALRLFACDCASRALNRWVKSGREPDPRNWEVIRKVRAVSNGLAPVSELAVARELADQACKEYIAKESQSCQLESTREDMSFTIKEQLLWYGALNAVSATCNPDYEDAAEYAAREGRREARRVGDEEREIAWQTTILEKLRIIPRITSGP
jgi:hypothetical protein